MWTDAPRPAKLPPDKEIGGNGVRAMMLFGVLMLAAAPVAAQSDAEQLAPAVPKLLSLKDQAELRDKWTAERLDTIVPALMREQGIDMWVLIARENMEDPVLATMLDARSLHARRRTILVFFDPGGGKPVERLTVSRYAIGNLFEPAWVPEAQPDQWKRLAELIVARNPAKIAVNISSATAFADGLTHSQYQEFVTALPETLRARIVPGEELAVGWLETRTAAEMARYPEIVRTAHAIIAEGLSNRVITPGVTTADDVVWWFRERIAGLKLATWFHPSVSIFRQGAPKELDGGEIIRPGDMLWTDFGIVHLGLATDTQHLAYVLKPGETDAPEGLRAGLAAANRVQDALTSSFRTGLSGNDMLVEARRKALENGLDPSIYSHPIGYHGHAAGAAIGFWDDQSPSDRGAHRLRPNTAWSIELSQTQPVPEWGGQTVQFRTEEDAFFDGQRVRYIDGRQTRFHLIRPR